jgi:hypothetical protein
VIANVTATAVEFAIAITITIIIVVVIALQRSSSPYVLTRKALNLEPSWANSTKLTLIFAANSMELNRVWALNTESHLNQIAG